MGRFPLETVRAVAVALGMGVDVAVRWHGGDLARVLNASHAALHEALAHHLGELPGWTWAPEVTYSIYGERGVIDILAWHAPSRTLLIIELKTELVDPQELVASMHRRSRLGRRIAQEQGWAPRTVSTWVVVRDSRTNRRHLRAHAGLLRAAFPADGHAMRAWLRQPAGSVAALSFWTDVGSESVRRAPCQARRVRPTRRDPER